MPKKKNAKLAAIDAMKTREVRYLVMHNDREYTVVFWAGESNVWRASVTNEFGEGEIGLEGYKPSQITAKLLVYDNEGLPF